MTLGTRLVPFAIFRRSGAEAFSAENSCALVLNRDHPLLRRVDGRAWGGDARVVGRRGRADRRGAGGAGGGLCFGLLEGGLEPTDADRDSSRRGPTAAPLLLRLLTARSPDR